MSSINTISCPRCNSPNVIDMGELVECNACGREFYRENLEYIGDKRLILSVEELKNLIKVIRE